MSKEISAGDKGFQQLITFSRSITPLPIESKQGVSDDKWINYGTDNLYPNFLLSLFGDCPLHRGIIGKKVNFLMGDGLVTKGKNDLFNVEINPVDTAEELIQKLVFDYVLFNYFAVEVQYDLLTNRPLYFNHIPANHVRSNKSKTKFWVCDDWYAKRSILSYDRWIKGRNEDRKSKIFFYAGYTPSVNNVYPDVDYKGSITALVTDILINNFNKNNIEDGFSPAHIISFFNGMPTADDADKFERKFKNLYTGSAGLKYLINYNNSGDEKGVQIDSIAGSDYATKLVEVGKKIENSILQSHSAMRLLFGVETEGSLGGNGTELETQYEIFKQTYVKNTRNVIESGLNKLFTDAGLPLIEFKDKSSLFSASLDTTTREKVLTIDELRAIDGKPALPNNSGNRLLTDTPAPSQFSEVEEVESKGKKLSDSDFELVKDLGVAKSDFEIVEGEEFNFAADDEIDNYLISEPINGKSLGQIKSDIKAKTGIDTTETAIAQKLLKLIQTNLITGGVSDGKVNLKPLKETKPASNIQVMYEYKVKAGYGSDLIPTSRSFCVKLINNDRLYTRSDIQQMSAIFGYDVFKHCGGWYFNSDTGKAENQCRHEWNAVQVRRKGTN